MTWLWLAAALTACEARGCLPSERVIIVYRGATPIEVAAPVIREEKTVGVISEVHAGQGAQRIVVVLKSASALRQNDRYLPFRSADKVGLKVMPGTGEPLRDGDTVEAGFQQRSAPGAPPRQVPSPVEPAAQRGGGDADARPPGNAPPDRGAPRDWHAVRPEQDLRQAGIQLDRYQQVPPALRRRPDEIAAGARGQSPDEAIAYLTRQLEEVPMEFDAAFQEARERGDRAAAGEIRSLRIKTLGMINRLRMQASKNRR